MNTTEEMTPMTVGPDDQARLLSAIGYLPPLFFVPLYLGKKDEYSVWHGKQGLIVTVLAVAGGILGPIVAAIIPVLGALAVLAYNVFVLVIIVAGAWHAYKGEKWELPVVGKFAKDLKI